MKLLIAPFFFLSMFMITCQNNPPKDAAFTAPAGAPDSVRVQLLKNYVDTINAHRQDMERLWIKPNIKSEDDKLMVLRDSQKNIKLARLDLVAEDTVTREYYFLKDNKMAYYQLMVWCKTCTQPYAWGLGMYLDNEGIAGATERRIELSTDEKPAALLMQPELPAKINVDSMAAEIEKKFVPVVDLVKKNEPASN